MKNLFILKIREKNSSLNLRFETFVMAFRVRKLFDTLEKRVPGPISNAQKTSQGDKPKDCTAL